MKKKRNPKQRKQRDWIAVWAFLRSGGGKHKDKSKYSRKKKHKNKTHE